MNDYFFRTSNEQQMRAAMAIAGLLQGERIAEGVFIDFIGVIPPVIDIDGEEIKPADARFHANVRCLSPLSAAQLNLLPTFDPLPNTPYRIFA